LTRNAGATPKLIASHRESRYAPKRLVMPALRATIPSRTSKIMAIRMKSAAEPNFSSCVLKMASRPQ